MMNLKTLYHLSALAAVSLAACSTVPAAPDLSGLRSGLSLYLPLDGSTTPKVAAGSTAVTAGAMTYEAGVVGQAAALTDKAIVIPGAANFDRKAGTISLWMKPTWSVSDPTNSFRTLAGTDNFQVCIQPSKNVMFFMTGTSKPQVGYQWDYGNADYNVAKSWKAGEWRHVAITWDSSTGAKAMYMDGKVVASNVTDLIRTDPIVDAVTFTLGRENAPGDYDEVAFWTRPLTATEIAQLHDNPEAAAKALSSTAQVKVSLAKPWPIIVSVVAPMRAQDTIVAPSESFTAKVPIKNASIAPWTGEIEFSLLDVRDAVRAKQRIAVTLTPGESRPLPVSFRIPERGAFKVAACVQVGADRWERDVASLASWPQPTGAPSAGSFFGYHVNSWSQDMLDAAARLGLGWERGHNMLQATWFIRAEPREGAWDYNHDFQIDNLKKRKMNILGQFFGTPYWAAASGGVPIPQDEVNAYPSGSAPKLDAFREYVTRTVNRFKGTIHDWETWNEPEVSMFWNGSPEQLAEMIKVAYEAAKAADPTCNVMHAGYTSAWNWEEQAAKAGAFKYGDAVSCHVYYTASQSPEEAYANMKATYDHFERLPIVYGHGKALPIWNTESGLPSTSWLRGLDAWTALPESVRPACNAAAAARRQVQFDALQQAIGYVRSFSYLQSAGDAGPYESLSTTDITNAQKPQVIARVAMAAQVDGARCAGMVRRPQGRFWAVVYQKPAGKGSVIVRWVGDGGQVRINAKGLGKNLRAVDFMGNDRAVTAAPIVTDEPSYLHVPANAVDVIKALKAAAIDVLRTPVALPGKAAISDAPNIGPARANYSAPMENPRGLFAVDLRRYANMGFYDAAAGDRKGGWSDEGPFNSLATMPVGKQSYFGVPFDIVDPATNHETAVITLRGKGATPSFPQWVTGIAVNHKARVLYFLQSCSWDAPGEIGRYLIRYADGNTATAMISIPRNCANWWVGAQPNEDSRLVPVRVTSTADGKPAWRYLRVWEWQNIKRDVAISSIDFVSSDTGATPILIAISGVE
ncbi:MAG TPA: LamG-like jellyroll fold domain-containing protein [Capsulimonadaceae bacterium]|jgi:hypothetical protein